MLHTAILVDVDGRFGNRQGGRYFSRLTLLEDIHLKCVKCFRRNPFTKLHQRYIQDMIPPFLRADLVEPIGRICSFRRGLLVCRDHSIIAFAIEITDLVLDDSSQICSKLTCCRIISKSIPAVEDRLHDLLNEVLTIVRRKSTFSTNRIDKARIISVKDIPGRLVTIKKRGENPRAAMEFASMDLARDLFDGKINAVACIGMGAITMKGMISMIDNMNRLLDRVALYLA